MTHLKRQSEITLTRNLGQKMPLIQVVVGPRQVGKTSLVKSYLAGRGIYVSADSPTPLGAAEVTKWWHQALSTPDRILAIDEVQKISGWSEIVKKLWDEKPHTLRLILTGSAALILEKGLKESLAGRFELIRCHHWSFSEAKELFGLSLRQFIEFGCYPGAMRFFDDRIRWAEYIRDSIVEPAIGRDILLLQPVGNPALLRQVFLAAISRPAQVVSLNKMQGQLLDSAALATIQHYLEMMSHGFLVSLLSKYSAEKIRLKKSSQKIIINDAGLMRAFWRPVESTITPDLFGRYFENAIGACLLQRGWELYYWQDRTWEVDFVALAPDGKKYAIEVKSAAAKEDEFLGLKRFCQKNPDFKPILISLVNQEIQGLTTWPGQEVLGTNHQS